MVLAIEYNIDPSMPEAFNKLYQAIVSAEGMLKPLMGVVVIPPPDGWKCEFTQSSTYKITHNLDNPYYAVNIDMRDRDSAYRMLEMARDYFVIETIESSTGVAAPREFKFQFRLVHTIRPVPPSTALDIS